MSKLKIYIITLMTFNGLDIFNENLTSLQGSGIYLYSVVENSDVSLFRKLSRQGLCILFPFFRFCEQYLTSTIYSHTA